MITNRETTLKRATTIDEVINVLHTIIEESEQKNNRTGFFTALYYKVTIRVKEAIERGEFEDNERIEKFDVVFANRYLDALDQFQRGESPTGPWKVAFDAAGSSRPIVLQHLLLGMNAHINLDLGIAAVEVTNPDTLEGMHNDFNHINEILGSMTFEVIQALNQVSPILSLMGLHAGNETILIQFSITNARDGAWGFANALNGTSGKEAALLKSERIRTIEKLGESLLKSQGLIKVTLWFIRLFEWRKASKIIRVLVEFKKKFIHVDLTKE